MKIKYIRWANQSNFNESDCFYLEDRNWDDFGYKTTYTLYYYENNGQINEIGDVKILNINEKNTTKTFIDKNNLDFNEEYISLGQTREYYEKVGRFEENKRKEILELLKDWSTYPEIKQREFKKLNGFKNSLLRTWFTSYLLENIEKIMHSYKKTELNCEFVYKTRLENASEDHIIDFDFTTKEDLPYRNFVLIGKNGVGKTKVIFNLIKDLLESNFEYFSPKMPVYNKIILFYYGEISEDISEDEDFIKIDLENKNNENELDALIGKIQEKQKLEYLKKVLNDLLAGMLDDQLKPKQELSSGHNVIYKLIVNLLANIEEDSLIIIDELEVHLHPNILRKVMIVIRRFLSDFRSYSIMATHSSLVLQQTPSRSIRVLERIDDYPITKKVSIECFGEILDEIDENIFGLNDSEAEYKEIFEELKMKHKKEEIEKMFEDKLSSNARIYLQALYAEE